MQYHPHFWRRPYILPPFIHPVHYSQCFLYIFTKVDTSLNHILFCIVLKLEQMESSRTIFLQVAFISCSVVCLHNLLSRRCVVVHVF